MRNISFQDLFVAPRRADGPAEPRQVTCAYFGPSFSRVARPLAPRTAWPGGLDPARHARGSIGFILAEEAAATRSAAGASPRLEAAPNVAARACPAPNASRAEIELARGTSTLAAPATLATPSDVESAPAAKRKKRKARICKEPGCDKYVVDHGLCIRHGGGKRCNVEGCNCRAQNRGLCWKHGGFTICKVEGCAKRAKSRGICWSHGGGTRCKTEGCLKIAVSLGRCWAHGGGKRCTVDACNKPASERTNNLCAGHFAWRERDDRLAQAPFEERR